MQLVDARAELRARGFDYLSDARANLMLNNAKDALEDIAEWPWLEGTLTGVQPPLTLSDFRSVRYVRDLTNDRELLPLDIRDIVAEDNSADPTRVGTPEFWWLDGVDMLRVYPVATPDIEIRYIRYTAPLVGDSDTPEIPARHQPMWIDFAVVEAYKDSDNFEHATSLLNDLDRRLQRMLEIYFTRNNQTGDFQQIRFQSEDW